MISHCNSHKITSLLRGMNKCTLMVEDPGEALLGIFSAKLWLTFSKHSNNKQMLSLFGFLESQPAKCLEYSKNTAITFALDWFTCALTGSIPPLSSHHFDCALFSGLHW